jgi:MFS family permease
VVSDDPDAPSLESSESPAPSLSHNRNFRLLWIGQVLSDLGTQFGALAYPLLILALTHSPVIAGVVGTVTSIAAFAVRLPAGALADRLDRRRTMIVCDGARALVLGLLAILVVLHAIGWPVVLAVAVVDRVGDTLFSPSSTAALANVVADEQLEGAWAATEARQYGANLAGPALGGILYGVGRAVPFFGDTISYGVSVLTSWRMRGAFRPTSEVERKGLWSEAFDGVRFLWRDALLRAVLIQAPLINFAFNGVIFTVILSLRHAGRSATEIGLIESSIMVGGLLGAIAAPKLQGRLSLSGMVISITAGGTLFFVLAAIISPSLFIAIPIAIPFFLAPTANAALFAVLLRKTPEEMRGRATNALLQVASGLAALSPLVAGLLVAHTSAHWAMGAFAAALGVSAVMALSLRGLREAESRS